MHTFILRTFVVGSLNDFSYDVEKDNWFTY